MPDNEPAPGQAEPTGGPGIGERLRAAREQRGLSIDQLAEYLRLDEVVVAALEADDFDALGAPVFVRGHLKTCARFLDLDVDELLGDYAAAAPEPVVRSASSSPGGGVPITISLLPWGAGALGLLLAAGLTVYLLQDDPDAAPDAAAPKTSQSAGSTQVPPAPAMSPIEPPAAAAAPEPAVRDEPPAVAAQPEPVAVPETMPVTEPEAAAEPPSAVVAAAEPEPDPAAANRQTLTLYFRGESWTEISDRNGRLLFGLQREGIRRELSGEAPFKLLLGNAPAVDLYVDDEPYDLPAGSTRGKVARFVIEPGPGRTFP